MNYQHLLAACLLVASPVLFAGCKPCLTSEEKKMKAQFIAQTITEYAAFKNGGKVDDKVVNDFIARSKSYNLDLDRPVDKEGRTLLMYSALSGHLTPVRTLRKEGVDMNKEDQKGNTALTLARKAQDARMVEYLKKYGARDSKKA